MSGADDWAAFFDTVYEDGRGHVLTTATLSDDGRKWVNPYDQSFGSRQGMHNAVLAANRAGRHAHIMIGSVDSSYSGRVKRAEFAEVDVRAFAFDFDVHHDDTKERKDTDYANASELVQALQQALQSGMPRPNFLVESGSGGIHLWYFISTILPHTGAASVRGALLDRLNHFGLRLDSDAGSKPNMSLRCPGTHNTKPHIQTPVRTRHIEKTTPDLPAFLRQWGIPRSVTRRRNVQEHNAEHADTPLPTELGVDAVKHCRKLGDNLREGGRDLSRSQWLATSALVRHTHPKIIRFWRKSCQNLYQPPPTDGELDAALDPNRGLKGPHTCEQIGGGAGCTACEGCLIQPSRNGNTYPLFHMARCEESRLEEKRAADLADMDEPLMASSMRGFTLGADGGVYRLNDGDGEGGTSLCEPDFGLLMRIRGQAITCYEAVCSDRMENPLRFPPEVKNSATKLADNLAKLDVAVYNRNDVLRLFQQMTNLVQNQTDERSSIGWISPTEFAAPTAVVTPTGLKPSAMALPPVNGKYLGFTGTTDVWYRAMRPILELRYPKSEMYLFSTLLGLSSILPAYLGSDRRPALVSFYNPQSGTGKTTMLKLGNSWFMQYCETSVGFDDTDANAMSVVGAMKHLYCNIDEITTKVKADPTAIAKMVRQLLLGIERGRMGSDGGQWERADWLCQVAVSTNESLFEISGDAGLSARIMEFSVSNDDKPLPEEVFNRLEEAMENNFGVAGLHMVQTLVSGGTVKEVAQSHFDSELKLLKFKCGTHAKDGTGRFRLNLMASVMTAAHLVNRFGKASVPLSQFRDWCVLMLQEASEKQTNIMVTSQYTFDEFYNDILRLGCVRNGNSGEEVSGMDTVGRNAPFYCFRFDDMLFIRREDISQYLHRNMRSRGTLDQWIKDGVLDGTEEERAFKQGEERLALASYLVVPCANITTFSEDQHEQLESAR